MRNTLPFILAVLVISNLILTGCSRHIELVYPPEGRVVTKTVPAADAKEITLLPFQDQREQGDTIGQMQSLHGYNAAKIFTESNATQWVTDAIAMELAGRGYKVTRVSRKQKPASGLVLSGELLSMSVNSRVKYVGDVSFMARLEEDGTRLFENPYFGRADIGLNWMARGKSYERALSETLATAVQKLLTDVEARVS